MYMTSLKVNGNPLPLDAIIVYKHLYGPNAALPWVVFANWLVHKNEGGAFVFTKKIRIPNTNKFARIAGNGTWSEQTRNYIISSTKAKETIGVVRKFSFTRRGPDGRYYTMPDPDGGNWTMYEYSLPNESTDLVICKVTRAVKNSSKRAAEESSFQERKIQKLLCADGPPQAINASEAAATGEDDDSWFLEPLPQEDIELLHQFSSQAINASEAAATGEDDDSWFLELLHGGGETAEGAAFPEEAAEGAAFLEGELDESWRSSVFDDIGFDVDSYPPYGGPAEAAATGEDEDIDKLLHGSGGETAEGAAFPEEAVFDDFGFDVDSCPPYGGPAEAAATGEDEGIDELLHGGGGGGQTAEGAAFPEGELDSSLFEETVVEYDPLQVSPPSPSYYDFNYEDTHCVLDDLWS